MSISDIAKIEAQLNLKLPQFYIETMLNYPFPLDSMAAELFLCTDVQAILGNNSLFSPEEGKFAIGGDGGEWTYYIKLNGEEKVYIYDLEGSYIHNTVASLLKRYVCSDGENASRRIIRSRKKKA